MSSRRAPASTALLVEQMGALTHTVSYAERAAATMLALPPVADIAVQKREHAGAEDKLSAEDELSAEQQEYLRELIPRWRHMEKDDSRFVEAEERARKGPPPPLEEGTLIKWLKNGNVRLTHVGPLKIGADNGPQKPNGWLKTARPAIYVEPSKNNRGDPSTLTYTEILQLNELLTSPPYNYTIQNRGRHGFGEEPIWYTNRTLSFENQGAFDEWNSSMFTHYGPNNEPGATNRLFKATWEQAHIAWRNWLNGEYLQLVGDPTFLEICSPFHLQTTASTRTRM